MPAGNPYATNRPPTPQPESAAPVGNPYAANQPPTPQPTPRPDPYAYVSTAPAGTQFSPEQMQWVKGKGMLPTKEAVQQAIDVAAFQQAMTQTRPVARPPRGPNATQQLPTPRMAIPTAQAPTPRMATPVPTAAPMPSRRAAFNARMANVVPQMRYAKGGAVSKRRNIDGIAQRGKTKGRIV